jgi:hypothetical protein
MEKNEVLIIHGKEVPSTLRKDVTATVEAFRANVNSSKGIAEVCYKLRTNPDFLKTFAPESEDGKKAFIAVVGDISAMCGCSISGGTAYKYAQCYELYHNTEYWNYFTIGKLVITSRLESNTAKTNRSTEKFVQWTGIDSNNAVIDLHEKWKQTNAEQLAKIEALKGMGFDTKEEEKRLTPKPDIMPYEPTNDADADREYFNTLGMQWICTHTDSQLKDKVSEYIECNLTEAEKAEKSKKAEGKTAESKTAESKTAESLLDKAIAALTAYTSTLEKVPTELMKASMKLQSMKAEK